MIKDFIKGLFSKGFKITISDGKPFDPHGQKRTTWQEDFAKKEKDKNVDNG